MRTDINCFFGAYPFRDVGPSDVTELLEAMTRSAITEAWVSHLSAVFWRDPGAGNDALFKAVATDARLRAVPAVHPGLPAWERIIDDALERHVPCVRADPTFYGLAPAGPEMAALVASAADRSIPIMLTVRFEDGRQRHPNDKAPALEPWAVRALIRMHGGVRLIVTHADRAFIEQVHFGSTPSEASRILWDISCIWGPPEDHLDLLLETVGPDRFAFGTGMPLHIAESSVAKMDLLDVSAQARERIDQRNAAEVKRRRTSFG